VSDDTIILIGNGPSLNQVTDEFLSTYPTFGSNWVHKRLIPTYYSVYGYNLLNTPEKIEAHRNAVKSAEWSFISGLHSLDYLYDNVRPIWPCNRYTYKPGTIGFSADTALGVYSYQTILYINLQITYWLGFKRVLIVGLDGDYGSPDDHAQHFYEDDELTKFVGGWESYRQRELRQRLADLAFAEARKVFEADGREIINLTPGSKCTAFLRVFDA